MLFVVASVDKCFPESLLLDSLRKLSYMVVSKAVTELALAIGCQLHLSCVAALVLLPPSLWLLKF